MYLWGSAAGASHWDGLDFCQCPSRFLHALRAEVMDLFVQMSGYVSLSQNKATSRT